MGSTISDTPPVPVFCEDKYDRWRVKMRIFLQCQGLWEFVELGYNVPDDEASFKENQKKDATALSYIQQGLSGDQFDKIIGATTAKEAWEILEKEFDGYQKVNANHDASAKQPVLAHPPPPLSVPMQQMPPGGYHNYPAPHYQCAPCYPSPYFYSQPGMQAPPGYPTYSPQYQHSFGYGCPSPPPMQSPGGGLVGTVGRVANMVEHLSPTTVTGASTGQQMGHTVLYSMSGAPPPALPSKTFALPTPEGEIPPPAVTPQVKHQNSQHMGFIIGQQFVSSLPINLRITRRIVVPGEGNFDISDCNGNRLFSVKGKLFTMHDERTMYDAFGNPLVTFCSKSMSMHDKWFAYRGNSTKSGKLFTTKRSSVSMIQIKASLDVTLAGKEKTSKNGKGCDFKVKGGLFDKSFTVHSVATNSIVAEMSAELNLQSIILDRDTYVVTVYPNIDYAFISSLLVIFDGIVEDDKGGPSKYKMLLRR